MSWKSYRSIGRLGGCMLFAATAIAVMPESTHAQGQQSAGAVQQAGRDAFPPPLVLPQGTRRSSKWIKLPSGTSVAVDKGITGDGVKVYNSLTWHLVAVDEKDETKVLWDKSVSAFWDKMAIEQIETDGEEEKTWALVMRSTRYEQFAEFLDLHTGELIKTEGEEPADGKAVTLRKTWSGSGGKRDEPLHAIVSSEEQWKKVYEDAFAGAETPADEVKDIDFTKEALLVYYGGKATNCRGFGVEGAYETENDFLLRVCAYTYQSDGNPPVEHPFGIFVIPRMTEKPYVIQTDGQGLIGGPDIWKESERFEPLKN